MSYRPRDEDIEPGVVSGASVAFALCAGALLVAALYMILGVL